VTDLDAAFDAAPVETADGPIIWATVTIEYAISGLSPALSIKVPVPWNDAEIADQRRAQALRCARQLIEHACRAAGVGPQEDASTGPIEDAIEAITPSALDGVAQELGLVESTTKPRQSRRDPIS
jgi:hypothetical protein